MGKITMRSSSKALVKALEDNLSAHARMYSDLPGAIFYEEPGILGLMTGMDVYESCIYRATLTPGQASGRHFTII